MRCTAATALEKNFDYAPFSEGYEAELTYIRNDKSLREVILSGGDPLSLSNQILGNLLEQISHIPHIKRIRFSHPFSNRDSRKN